MSPKIKGYFHARFDGTDAPWTHLVKSAKAVSRRAFPELVDLFQDDIFKMVTVPGRKWMRKILHKRLHAGLQEAVRTQKSRTV